MIDCDGEDAGEGKGMEGTSLAEGEGDWADAEASIMSRRVSMNRSWNRMNDGGCGSETVNMRDELTPLVSLV